MLIWASSSIRIGQILNVQIDCKAGFLSPSKGLQLQKGRCDADANDNPPSELSL